jgi:glutamate-5-semialdehyde dehydrogenase
MNRSEFEHRVGTAKEASYELARLTAAERADLVLAIGSCIGDRREEILTANKTDLDRSPDSPLRDRLLLNPARIDSMVVAAGTIAMFPDSVGVVLDDRPLSSGPRLQRISVPFGLIGMIYESRPSVTFDASALAMKSGNAVVLRGGSEAYNSNEAICGAIRAALKESGLSEEAVWLMPPDRELVSYLLTAEGLIDVLIPRGSDELIKLVRREATVPTIETGVGVCHTYVASTANLIDAASVVLNAKLQRPTVCNALDTVIVDQCISSEFLPMLLDEFHRFEVEVAADDLAHSIFAQHGYESLHLASDVDFRKEYLGYGCSVRTVADLDEALAHIRTYSSKHSEAILSEDEAMCERFLAEVDAAVVLANASTRFTDGEVFGLGAEMGISTQKLHARGPFSFEKLVTEKWLIRGQGDVRR